MFLLIQKGKFRKGSGLFTYSRYQFYRTVLVHSYCIMLMQNSVLATSKGYQNLSSVTSTFSAGSS